VSGKAQTLLTGLGVSGERGLSERRLAFGRHQVSFRIWRDEYGSIYDSVRFSMKLYKASTPVSSDSHQELDRASVNCGTGAPASFIYHVQYLLNYHRSLVCMHTLRDSLRLI
jgi:hypothetical protein